MQRVLGLTVCALSLVVAVFAGSSPARDGLDFVAAPAAVGRACAATAKLVGYAVPCPRRVPRGLVGELDEHGCAGGLVFAPFRSVATYPGARSWRGWVAGAGATPDGTQFALTASPQVEPSIARLVNGPAWYPAARVQALGHSRVGSRLVRWAFVPAQTNDGSQFSGAVVAVWSARGHSYAIGFAAAPAGRVAARALDERLLAGLALVGP